ncbi:MAG: hypothetical protein IRY91_16115 [Gemmatimonadaceae bacterium]|nr:hypothetical protein [Gemmatimonadaceae bacterium]
MKPVILYRAASVILVLFAAGHTHGFLNFKPPTTEGLAVRDAMNNVSFRVRSGVYTYGGFYRGFGLFVTAYLLFCAFLAWQLGDLARARATGFGAMAWGLVAVQVASLVLSWIYFSPPPMILSAVVVACLAWAAALWPAR